MSEERNKDSLVTGGTAEQEVSPLPEVCQDDTQHLSSELDSSKENSQSFVTSSTSPQEGLEDCDFESLKGVSPTSLAVSPVEGAVGGEEHGSSERALDELNKIATILNRCSMKSGKLNLFQMFFREPGMYFFVKPEGRRRHNAGRQTSRQAPTDSTEQEESSGREVPRPILNQARAIVGYTGLRPKTEPLDHESEREHSIGSTETIPIDEVYLPDFSTIFLPDETGFSGYRKFDSLLRGVRVSPEADADLRQAKLGTTEAVDIPSRPESGPEPSGSFPNTRPVLLTRRYSLQFEPFVPSLPADQPVPKRKISQDSSNYSGRHRSVSRESSVDLESYMTPKLQNEADSDTSAGNLDVSSADSSHSLPVPDLDISLIQEQILDSPPTPAMDSAQLPVPRDSAPATTDEGGSSENV